MSTVINLLAQFALGALLGRGVFNIYQDVRYGRSWSVSAAIVLLTTFVLFAWFRNMNCFYG